MIKEHSWGCNTIEGGPSAECNCYGVTKKEKINNILIKEDHNTGVMIDKLAELIDMPEYNFAQLKLLIHALEMLDISEYDLGYRETHKYLLERFREMIK